MNYTIWTSFVVLVTCSSSVQQPTFFRNTFKGLNGLEPKTILPEKGEIRVVYYHDQTIAVLDGGPSNQLKNCNLIEVYEPAEAGRLLKNLSSTYSTVRISFSDMTNLMQRCQLLDEIKEEALSATLSSLNKGSQMVGNSLSILSGILPGTKWCGTGDIADNYHDLGLESQIDRCCRTHDLCPIKVRAQQTRYNLTNNSIYTKSHCTCDRELYKCLKASNHPTADIMGQIYFNIVKVPCIEDIPRAERRSTGTSKRFIPVNVNY